jgi:hypothetical protein
MLRRLLSSNLRPLTAPRNPEKHAEAMQLLGAIFRTTCVLQYAMTLNCWTIVANKAG